jgi:flagellin
MVISSLTGIGGTQSQQNVQNADSRLRAAIASIVSGRRNDDVARVSIASQLQSTTSELRQASSNLALGSSLSQVADGGAEQIQKALTQLQSLAQQASSPVLNDENRAQLNEQFKQLTESIDRLAKGTSFNGKSLLDGSLSGDDAVTLGSLLGSPEDSLGSSLSVDNLSSSSLLGSSSLNILSADSAGQALTSIQSALNQITSTRANIGAFQQAADFAAANVESAIVNQEAAQSTLSDTDFAEASTESSLAEVQRNASIALAAQGNRLTPALLQLIG